MGWDNLPKAVQSHSPRYWATGLRPQKLPLCTQEKFGHLRSFGHRHMHQTEGWDLLWVGYNLIKEEAPHTHRRMARLAWVPPSVSRPYFKGGGNMAAGVRDSPEATHAAWDRDRGPGPQRSTLSPAQKFKSETECRAGVRGEESRGRDGESWGQSRRLRGGGEP